MSDIVVSLTTQTSNVTVGGGSSPTLTVSSGDQISVVVGSDAAVVWDEIVDKPSAFAPAAHVHDAADIASGIISPSRLGTGTASSLTYLRGDGQWAEAFTSTLDGGSASTIGGDVVDGGAAAA